MTLESDDMKNISFQFRKHKNLALILGSKTGGKALLSVMITEDLVSQGMDARVIVKFLAKEINGSGGGQVFYATAGGLNINGLSNALNKVVEMFR